MCEKEFNLTRNQEFLVFWQIVLFVRFLTFYITEDKCLSYSIREKANASHETVEAKVHQLNDKLTTVSDIF